jgi:hypothetical protein
MPGECHPAYANMPWLRDWVNGLTGYPRDRVMIPAPRLSVAPFGKDSQKPIESMPAPLMMTRKRCARPAPYVGRPFCYTWEFGVDNLGRAVAGDAKMQYTGYE